VNVIGFVPREPAIVLGRFQRSCDAPPSPDAEQRYRRTSGGPAVRIGPGVVCVRKRAVGISPDAILNREVRPLLRALTRVTGRPVSYFGRDWISCGGRPVGIVAFGHEAATGSSVFDAFVSARDSACIEGRSSYLGKAPATLDVDPARALEAIAAAYGEGALEEIACEPVARGEPAWEASLEEAIGPVCAGHDAAGVLRVGGELMASSDAVAKLEEMLFEGASADEVGAAIDETLAGPGVALFGVRSLRSIRDVLLRARAHFTT